MGRIGIEPQSMQPGDRVVVFWGAKTPFILRRNASDSEQSEKFKLVEDFFVSELMEAQAFTMGLTSRIFRMV